MLVVVTDDKPKLPVAPEGCRAITGAGWAPLKSAGDIEHVASGSVFLPRRFHCAVITPERVLVILCFEVSDEGEVELPQVYSQPVDVPQALDILRRIRPIDFWRRFAITEMVIRDLAGQLDAEHAARVEQDEELAAAEGAWLENDEPWPEGEGMRINIREFMPGIGDAIRKAQDVPVRGQRRNRITGKHLDEVAQVYVAADAAGEPPTRAVADHFKTSHSTAARWVGLARKQEKLPPARKGTDRDEG